MNLGLIIRHFNISSNMVFPKTQALKLVMLLLSSFFIVACVSIPGQISSQNGEFESAKKSVVEPIEVDEDLPNLELNTELLEQLLIANFASNQGDWTLAAKNTLAAAKNSQDYRLARLTAFLALRAENFKQAVEGAELWVALEENPLEAKVTLLRAQLEASDIAGAIKGFERNALENDVDINVHIKEVAAILVRQNNSESAIAVLQSYILKHPKSSQVALSSAYVAERFKRDDLAEQWLNVTLGLKPDWDLAAQMKAALLARQGKMDERSNYIAEYLISNPLSVGMRINHAAELARDKKYQDALSLMQQVLSEEPENVSALNYSAALAQQLERTELAKDYYQQALKVDPSNDEIRWALARFAVQDEQYLRAERYYQQIQSEGNYFQAQLQVANMRYFTRGLDGAITALRILEPKTEKEYVARATTRHYLLLQDYKYEEAFGAINETLAYLPENIELMYARALVAAELNELQTAEDDLRFIIGKDPSHANALNALGYTLADQTNRYQEAKELILQALELRPNQAHILDSMGWVFYRLDEFEQAVDFLQRAYDKAPEVEVAAHLGEVLWEKGEEERARIVWLEAFRADDKNPLLNKTLERYGINLE